MRRKGMEMPRSGASEKPVKERAPKTANGLGGIRQRKEGIYEARITLADGSRMSIYGKSHDEVSAAMIKALNDRNEGLPVKVDGKQTVKTYLEGWLEAIKGNVRPKTYQGYECYVRVHVLPALGKIRMAKLTPQQLQAFYSKKLEGDISPTTVRHLHATLHRAFEQAVRWGVVARNVANLVDPPRRRHKEMVALTPDQARALLEAAAEDRLEALYVLAVTTGMREGELLGLRWKDVDLDAATLQVRATMQRTKVGGLAISQPKTAASRRQIALTGMAVAALRRRKIRQAEEKLKTGPAWEDNDLVFPNTLGKPMEATNLLHRSFAPLLEKTALPKIRFHDLRHTAATVLLRKRVPAKVVSEMLGHSNIGITLQVYSHVLPDMQREATAAMEAALMG